MEKCEICGEESNDLMGCSVCGKKVCPECREDDTCISCLDDIDNDDDEDEDEDEDDEDIEDDDDEDILDEDDINDD